MPKRRDLILAVLLGTAAGLMVAAGIELGFAPARRYSRHFTLALTAFCVAFALQYGALMFIAPAATSIPLAGHAWRIGFVIAIGAVAAAITAAFSSTARGGWFLFALVPAAIYLSIFVARSSAPRVLRFVLPFGLIVNWRRDGWGWAFAGSDVLMWSLVGLVGYLAVTATRSRAASA